MTDISPCKDDIQIYLDIVFSYCEGLIPCRSFPEKGSVVNIPPHPMWIKSDKDSIDGVANFAKWAHEQGVACYVIPGTVAASRQAKSADILQMQTVLVDIDTGNTEEKLQKLTAIANPSLIVESGGITAEGFKKLHVYWKLSEAATGEELQKLLKLRHNLALYIIGDTSFQSAHQPIRVAGSIYHKGDVSKPVTIRSHNKLEYNLGELIELGEEQLKLDNLPVPDSKDFFDFNNVAPTIEEVLVTEVHEGGEGDKTRFASVQKVAGHWLTCYHNGIIHHEDVWKRITGYNAACVVPPLDDKKLESITSGLWKIHVGKYGEPKHHPKPTTHKSPICKSFSLGTLLNDNSPMPDDIIAPRLLTPGGMLVFGGAPKVGKSDFLLSMLVHMAAGIPFLGFTTPRPQKIFYLQAEIQYHYLRERTQIMQLPPDIIKLAENNLIITSRTNLYLNEDGVNEVCRHIEEAFSQLTDKPDIIVIDPLRNMFDGGAPGTSENDNDAMIFFLQKRVEQLRDRINPDAGVIIVHHTKKITHNQFKEDPFQAFSGASSLRGYYTAGMLLYKPDIDSDRKLLLFELRNGPAIPTKLVSKEYGKWVEENILSERITNQKYGGKLDAERNRKHDVIINKLRSEALINSKAYTANSFCEAFEGESGMGSKDSILERLKVLTTKGYIKFFKNTQEYGIKKCTSSYGLMCIENMELLTPDGEIKKVLPTHYKHHELGYITKVEDPHNWIIYEEQNI